jgi:imidazole glycerol-phosphate synthase subunit HisH
VEQIAIIDYGAGNLKSVQFALERLGRKTIVTHDPRVLTSADRVIFPGVGRADSALEKLKEFDLDKIIVELKRPFLGICLGIQLMCGFNEEGNISGLGIFKAPVKQFTIKGKIPHMGWNGLLNPSGQLLRGINSGASMYFVHSYYIPVITETCASCEYEDQVFSAVMQKDNFYGCQFHPEKSGALGELIIRNFLTL